MKSTHDEIEQTNNVRLYCHWYVSNHKVQAIIKLVQTKELWISWLIKYPSKQNAWLEFTIFSQNAFSTHDNTEYFYLVCW